MSDNDAGIAFLIGLCFGLLFMITINDAFTVDTKSVKSEKQFIFGESTYKCKMTNKLIGENK